jgi:hypothetical protein
MKDELFFWGMVALAANLALIPVLFFAIWEG